MIPQELIEKILKREVILFLGSGVSVSTESETGFPGSGELAKKLAESMEIPLDDTLLSEIAQMYEYENNRNELVLFLQNIFLNEKILPLKSHTRIASVCSKGIFHEIYTTNYDCLLEKAFNNYLHETGYEVFVKNEDMAFMKQNSKIKIFKIHGSINDRSTIIITQNDYKKIYSGNTPILNHLKDKLATMTFLFVGYGLKDFDFLNIYNTVKQDLGGLQRQAYVVFPKPAGYNDRKWQIESGKWHHENIKVIEGYADTFFQELEENIFNIEKPSAEKASSVSAKMKQNSLNYEFIEIPPGEFIFGCSEGDLDTLIYKFRLNPADKKFLLVNERKSVFLTGYKIGKYSVTNEQYLKFVRSTGYDYPSHWNKGEKPFDDEIENHPVVNVTWYDAQEFCKWAGFRLPKELEWEKAARGSQGNLYPWGNTFDPQKCNSFESPRVKTVPVNSFEKGKSPYNIFNMVGNVWEWNSSGNYLDREIRGGSFDFDCRLYGIIPFISLVNKNTFKRKDTGFRTASDAGNSEAKRHNLVLIKEGSFEKGFKPEVIDMLINNYFLDPESRNDFMRNEYGVIKIPDFFISAYAVTNKEYLKFVKETRHPYPDHWIKYEDPPYLKEIENHPVVHVSWLDAAAYCKWVGLRLPTGDEWEKAARGSDGRLYPWGNLFDSNKCNSADTPRINTVPVNSFEQGKSPFGLFNMTGNTLEWIDKDNRGYRALRGGSYKDSCEIYGTTFATFVYGPPEMKNDDFGFRCALDI